MTPDEVAGIVEEISSRRTSDDAFDVVVWVLAEDAEACAVTSGSAPLG